MLTSVYMIKYWNKKTGRIHERSECIFLIKPIRLVINFFKYRIKFSINEWVPEPSRCFIRKVGSLNEDKKFYIAYWFIIFHISLTIKKDKSFNLGMLDF